ncbi:MAG: ABC transporter permease [Pseudohongiellaceae bacterium]
MTANRDYGKWLIWPAIILLILFILAPAVEIFRASIFDPEFTTEHINRILERDIYLTILWRTIKVSLIVSILSALIAYPVAYFIVKRPRQQQFAFLFLIFVPMWMNVLIRTYAWMVVLGREGIINSTMIALGLIDESIQMLFTSGAVYVSMIQILLPIQIVTCYSAMTEIDFDLIRAARILGASPAQAMRKVFLPLSLDGTITGMIIVFMLSMGFFITPALVGGPTDLMLGNLIEMQVEQLNWGFAAMIAILLFFSTLIIVLVLRRISKMLTKSLSRGSL